MFKKAKEYNYENNKKTYTKINKQNNYYKKKYISENNKYYNSNKGGYNLNKYKNENKTKIFNNGYYKKNKRKHYKKNNKYSNHHVKTSTIYKKLYRLPGERYNRSDQRFVRKMERANRKNYEKVPTNQRRLLLSRRKNFKTDQIIFGKMPKIHQKMSTNQRRLLLSRRKNKEKNKIIDRKNELCEKKNSYLVIQIKGYDNASRNIKPRSKEFEAEIEIQHQNFISTNKKVDLSADACRVMLCRFNTNIRLMLFKKKKFSKKNKLLKKQQQINNYYKFNKFSKNKNYNKRIILNKNRYLYKNIKMRTGIFVTSPVFKNIQYPFPLNLKLVDEYFSNC